MLHNQVFKVCFYTNITGGEMVEAEFRNIQIVKSPYAISFKKTPKFFKPGMSFDIAVNLTGNLQVICTCWEGGWNTDSSFAAHFFQVEVVNPDKTPAHGVKVVVNPGNVEGYTAANGLAMLTINSDAGARELAINVSVTLHFH